MKRPTFVQGALAALLLALAGAAAFTGFGTFLGWSVTWKLTITLLSGGYVLYLLKSSDERTGRTVTFCCWTALAIVAWWFTSGNAALVVAHGLMIWLVRSLYFHGGVLTAAGDLLLTGLGMGAGLWALTQSESLFLAIWCSFLVQALFVYIPTTLTEPAESSHPAEPFGRAHRAAQNAARRIATQR